MGFHTPYYPQANGTVEQTNGLIKRHADVSRHNWDIQLSQAVFTVNNHWEVMETPKFEHFVLWDHHWATTLHWEIIGISSLYGRTWANV